MDKRKRLNPEISCGLAYLSALGCWVVIGGIAALIALGITVGNYRWPDEGTERRVQEGLAGPQGEVLRLIGRWYGSKPAVQSIEVPRP